MVALVLAVAGCGSSSAKTETPPVADTSTSPVEQRFQTVLALKDAAVAAGLPCPAWVQDNVVQVAAESGNCDDESVLSTYATEADLEEAIRNLQDMRQLMVEQNIPDSPVLVGPNWIINAPTADKIAAKLGGIVDN